MPICLCKPFSCKACPGIRIFVEPQTGDRNVPLGIYSNCFWPQTFNFLCFAKNTIRLSSPKPGHTTGGSGRGGARRDGGAGRERSGWDADESVRPEYNRPSYPSDDRREKPLGVTLEARTKGTLCKPKGEQNPQLNRIHQRSIRGTTAALRSWLLTTVPMPICLCKPLSCKASPGIMDLARGSFSLVHVPVNAYQGSCHMIIHLNNYLSNPKPRYTTGGARRGGTRRGGGAGQERAGWDDDG